MVKLRILLVILVSCLVAAGCASGGMTKPRDQIDMEVLARQLGCKRSEVPFCSAAHCKVDDYYCVDKSRVLATIFPGIRN